MKNGARGIAPLIVNLFKVDSLLNALGFGWLFAYLVMSGSPVAAAALTFLDAGAVDRLGAFAMITGSRLGAAFIVLFIRFVYILRGHERRSALSIGLLSLIVTASIYLPALVVGGMLLQHRVLDSVQLNRGGTLSSILDQVFTPLIQPLIGVLPGWLIFLVGLGIIILSFYLFDRALPALHLERSSFGQTARLVYRPLSMFALGSILTLLTMSVSLSLSLLVPLSARGYVRRENVIPYIMGANITTFVDTLLAAVLIGNPDAFTVVLVEVLSVAIISLMVLLLFFHNYEQAMLRLVALTANSKRNLAIFIFLIFITPLVLILL
jgi:Na+/phosphate symporter